MNDRIANLVKAVHEAGPRETLEKFDIVKIERTNETLDEFVARIEKGYDEGDKTQDKANFIAREINELLERRQKNYKRNISERTLSRSTIESAPPMRRRKVNLTRYA